MMNRMIEAITELIKEEKKHQLIPRPSMELLFTLSSKTFRQLNEECNYIRFGTRACDISKFYSQFGSARILEGKDQNDDILVYKRPKTLSEEAIDGHQ